MATPMRFDPLVDLDGRLGMTPVEVGTDTFRSTSTPPTAALNTQNAFDNPAVPSRRVAAWDESMTSRTATWPTGRR